MYTGLQQVKYSTPLPSGECLGWLRSLAFSGVRILCAKIWGVLCYADRAATKGRSAVVQGTLRIIRKFGFVTTNPGRSRILARTREQGQPPQG
jgi:hypothetical protein